VKTEDICDITVISVGFRPTTAVTVWGFCVCRLHDRKIFVLGLCTLLSMTGGRPQVLNDEAHRILPSLILVFKGLKRAYECET